MTDHVTPEEARPETVDEVTAKFHKLAVDKRLTSAETFYAWLELQKFIFSLASQVEEQQKWADNLAAKNSDLATRLDAAEAVVEAARRIPSGVGVYRELRDALARYDALRSEP